MKTTKRVMIGVALLMMLGIMVVVFALPENSDTDIVEQDSTVCTMEYKPVCGADGITYGNPCMAGEIAVVHDGECEQEATNAAGGTFLAGSEIPELTDEELAAS